MREIRPLSEADVDAAVAIRTFARWGKNDAEHRRRYSSYVASALGSFEDGSLAAIAGMLELEAYVGGHKVTIGGLGGVATAPTRRRRGHVAGLLRAWFERLHDRGIGLSTEFPFDPSFYARYGYQTLLNGRVFDIPVERLAAGRPQAVGAGPDREVGLDRGHEVGPVHGHEVGPERWHELRPIHEAYARRFSLSLARTDAARDHWNNVLAPFWAPEPFHVFLMEDAYVVIGIDDSQDGPAYPKARVRDLAYASPSGRASVFGFLADLAGQVARVRIHLPPGDPLLAMWNSWYTTESISCQVRVVDVDRALAPLRAERERSFRLLLRDRDCPWNDGLFVVELTRDGCSARRSTGTADGVGPGSADVALDVNSLAALLFGAIDPSSALATGRAEGDAAALTDLSRLLGGRTVFVSEADHF